MKAETLFRINLFYLPINPTPKSGTTFYREGRVYYYNLSTVLALFPSLLPTILSFNEMQIYSHIHRSNIYLGNITSRKTFILLLYIPISICEHFRSLHEK